MLRSKIGIDLGTVNSFVFIPGRGIFLQLPTVVAKKHNRFFAFGENAQKLQGKIGTNIRVIYPLKQGIIADFKAAEAFFFHIFNLCLRPWQVLKPEIVLSVSANANSAERRLLTKACLGAGAGRVYLVLEPFLAALGYSSEINKPEGQMLVHIGGGSTEVAIVSMGSVVATEAIRVGGRDIDSSIQDLIKKRYGLQISPHTAEQIKLAIGRVHPKEQEVLEFRGTDILEGLPKEVEISNMDIAEILEPFIQEVIAAIKKTFSKAAPELLSDIMDKGIILTGGGAQLPGLVEFISQEVKLNVSLAKDPALCVARGTSVILSDLKAYKEALMRIR